ncbi:MAG: FtsX-like permease family protein, partial [Symploca sp. SIO3C6]|nr:FtsX-like permease family protein [Symploca sp. SIO3C6]
FIRQAVQIVYQDQDTAATGIGTDPHFPTIKNFYPVEGRFFTENELATAARVVVLGSKVRDDLFGPNEMAVNASMRIDGERFQVIGVMESKGAIGTEDVDTQVFIPLSTMASRIIGNNALSGISISGAWVQARSQSDLEAAQFQVTNLLRLRHNIYPPQEDDFWIANQLDLLNTLSKVVTLFTVMIAAISAISLLVGGIGIANIMLISVVERTHEIGIRKAIGASESHIFIQFLTEAMLISLGGGAAGIIVGIQIAFGAAIALNLPFVVSYNSVAFAFMLCFMVGLISGVLPARRAAKLDPVAALAGG